MLMTPTMRRAEVKTPQRPPSPKEIGSAACVHGAVAGRPAPSRIRQVECTARSRCAASCPLKASVQRSGIHLSPLGVDVDNGVTPKDTRKTVGHLRFPIVVCAATSREGRWFENHVHLTGPGTRDPLLFDDSVNHEQSVKELTQVVRSTCVT
jgi:hypothetical protein